MSASALALPPKSVNDPVGQAKFDRLAEAVGCSQARDVLDCLRRVDAAKITDFFVAKKWDKTWIPTLDGFLIPEPPVNLVNSGSVLHVPTLVTSCRHDGVVFTYPESFAKGKLDQERVAKKFLGPNADGLVKDLLQLYDPSLYDGGAFAATTDLLTDGIFRCPVLEYTKAIQPHVPAVYYMLQDSSLWLERRVSWMTGLKDMGAFHGSELLLLFDPIRFLAFSHKKLIRDWQQRFFKFALTGNPILSSKSPKEKCRRHSRTHELSGIGEEEHFESTKKELPGESSNRDPVDSCEACELLADELVRFNKHLLLDEKCFFWTGLDLFAYFTSEFEFANEKTGTSHTPIDQ